MNSMHSVVAARETYVPPGQRLETTFLPDKLVEFLQVCHHVVCLCCPR